MKYKYRIIEIQYGEYVTQVRKLFFWFSIDRHDPKRTWTSKENMKHYCVTYDLKAAKFLIDRHKATRADKKIWILYETN